MARAFTKTDGDLRAVLETMLLSREFFSEGAWHSKVKSPLEMVASAARALDADTIDTSTLVQRIGEMGEPLYSKEAPTGYKDTADSWLSTASLMARIGFSNAMANGQIAGVKVDSSRFAAKDADTIARELLGADASGETLAAIRDGLQDKQASFGLVAALVLSSPEFQRR
jgi:uncharacterized protein (DUF1800 family)